MKPMVSRIIQILLVIFGFLFLVVGVFALRTTPPDAGLIASFSFHIKAFFYLFIGLLCLLGAHRLNKRQGKKPSPPPPTPKL